MVDVDNIGRLIENLRQTPAPEYCFLWIDWWPMCMTKAEWSGWVQAIGSIAAILVAVKVASQQHERAVQAKRDEEADRIEARAQLLLGIASEADAAVSLQPNEAPDQNWLQQHGERRRAVGLAEGRIDRLRAAVVAVDLEGVRAEEVAALVAAVQVIDVIQLLVPAMVTEAQNSTQTLIERAAALKAIGQTLQILGERVRAGLH